MTIGLFFGSSTGATARAAGLVRDIVAENDGGWSVELLDVAEYYLEEMLNFDYLILGIPTWNHGQLQTDWEGVWEEFDALDMGGKPVALFGLGDQDGYPDTFGDALFFLADRVRTQGAVICGHWPTTGYDFTSSWAVENDRFLGLMLDDDNQADLTELRIRQWIPGVLAEFATFRPA